MGTNKDPNKQVETPQAANPVSVSANDIVAYTYYI